MNTNKEVKQENILNNLSVLDSFESKDHKHNNSLFDLKMSNNNVATEDLLGSTIKIILIINLINLAFTIIGELVKSKIRSKSDTTKRTETVSGFVRNKAVIERSTKDLNYKSLVNKRFPAPVGLKVPLIVMGKELASIGSTIFKDLLDTIDTYSVLLSVVISDSLEKKTNKSISIFSKDAVKKDKEIKKVLTKLIKKGNGEDTQPLGFLVGNGKQINELITITDTLVRTYNDDVIKNINDRVEVTGQKMDLLIKALKEGTVNNVSKPVIQDLVNGSEAVAKYVTTVSALYYAYDQFANSVIKIVKHVKK